MYQVRDIKISEIATSALNPRKTFDQAEIEELAQSIKENGLIQAITLRKIKGENGIKYEVVCGERRYRAVKFLGNETIQAVVKDLDDKQAFACMVIENLQRKDIDPLEEAAALRYLYKESSVPIKEIAKIIGKSQSFVINRIQLNNITSEFVSLMRDGTINLSHLNEIAKLTKEQQEVLLASCFQPAQIERWGFKTFSVEKLREWIDEHVMCTLSTAKFDPYDESYTTCGSCEKCKFNTAARSSTFGTDNTPRCMRMEYFKKKNQEAVLRQAKALGYPVVYAGNPKENKDIITAAQELGLYPQPLGNRQYMIEPSKPSIEEDAKDEKSKKRLANYERVRAVFNENLHAGIIMKVFEISYSGILSGEVKYLLNMQSEEVAKVDEDIKISAERLSMYKTELRAVDEAKDADRIERQRSFMETANYATKTETLDDTEENVFLALLASRLPVEFRTTVGLGYESAIDVTTAFDNLKAHRSAIIREFIRTMLSDKSVGYSNTFASLLDITLKNQFAKDVETIEQELAKDYESKCKDYEARIAELEAKLVVKNQEEISVDETSSSPEAKEEEPAEKPVEEMAEAVA